MIGITNLIACNEKTTSLYEIVNDNNNTIASIIIINCKDDLESKSYTDVAHLERLEEYLKQVKCTPNDPPPATGWTYRFQIVNENGNTTDIKFAGSNSVINNKHYNMVYPDISDFVSELDSIPTKEN